MTYTDKRLAGITITEVLSGLLKKNDSISIEVNEHGIHVRVFRKQFGNRAPVAQANRKCLADAISDIEKQLK